MALPLVGVMAAVFVAGESAAGVIYDPFGRHWSVALRGEGAWARRADGEAADLRVARFSSLDHCRGTVSWDQIQEPRRASIALALHCGAATLSLRCAAHEYRLLAAGDLEFLYSGRTFAWKDAPGWLLHREAGGFGAMIDGSAYDPLADGRGLLCAPDEDSWSELRARFVNPRARHAALNSETLVTGAMQ